MTRYLTNVMRVALKDFDRISHDSEMFRLFLDEYRKLFQRQNVQGQFTEVTAIILRVLND